ncbi:hypothetical protein BZA77DRAFT_349961 [Pyronema omphalodes]|nr:hypothetical protein BZA77DRAFT_349961 [Pyronema omphalodes]
MVTENPDPKEFKESEESAKPVLETSTEDTHTQEAEAGMTSPDVEASTPEVQKRDPKTSPGVGVSTPEVQKRSASSTSPGVDVPGFEMQTRSPRNTQVYTRNRTIQGLDGQRISRSPPSTVGPCEALGSERKDTPKIPEGSPKKVRDIMSLTSRSKDSILLAEEPESQNPPRDLTPDKDSKSTDGEDSQPQNLLTDPNPDQDSVSKDGEDSQPGSRRKSQRISKLPERLMDIPIKPPKKRKMKRSRKDSNETLRTDVKKPKTITFGQVGSGHVESEQIESEQVESGQVESEQVESEAQAYASASKTGETKKPETKPKVPKKRKMKNLGKDGKNGKETPRTAVKKPKTVTFKQVESEQVESEQVESEHIGSEQVGSDQVESEQVESEQVAPEAQKSESALKSGETKKPATKPEVSKKGKVKRPRKDSNETSGTAAKKPKTVTFEELGSEQIESEQVGSEKIESEQVGSEQVESEQVGSDQEQVESEPQTSASALETGETKNLETKPKASRGRSNKNESPEGSGSTTYEVPEEAPKTALELFLESLLESLPEHQITTENPNINMGTPSSPPYLRKQPGIQQLLIGPNKEPFYISRNLLRKLNCRFFQNMLDAEGIQTADSNYHSKEGVNVSSDKSDEIYPHSITLTDPLDTYDNWLLINQWICDGNIVSPMETHTMVEIYMRAKTLGLNKLAEEMLQDVADVATFVLNSYSVNLDDNSDPYDRKVKQKQSGHDALEFVADAVKILYNNRDKSDPMKKVMVYFSAIYRNEFMEDDRFLNLCQEFSEFEKDVEQYENFDLKELKRKLSEAAASKIF